MFLEPLDISNTKDQCNKCCDVNMYKHKEVVFITRQIHAMLRNSLKSTTKKRYHNFVSYSFYKCSICDIDEKHLKTSFSSDFRLKGIWNKNIELYSPVHVH